MIPLLLVAALALPADTVLVRGTVFDSIAGRPMAGALVQLARADSGRAEQFSASTDSSGAFIIRAVPAGRYLAGFYHPLLDSLGLELPDRVIDVGANARVSLGTPSPATMIRAFCGDSADVANHTLLFGHVHDARTESAVENASVTVTWAGAEQTEAGLAIIDRMGSTTSRRSGLFALCGVPADVPLSVRIARAADSTVVAVRVPRNGVLHVALLTGSTGATGRIVGHVLDKAKRPVIAAHVSAGDRDATVNDAGAFTLDNVPTGSQSVDVRAIGYAQASSLVNVAAGRATNVDVALERVVMLPGVIARDSAMAVHLETYLADKRTSPVATRFVDQQRLPGYKTGFTACQLVTEASGRDYCNTPGGGGIHFACGATVVNGEWTSLTMGDIDPDDIIGVEYFKRYVPAKYSAAFAQRGTLTPCRFIIWTRCPGAAIPRCGDNPASNAANRPPNEELLDLPERLE